MGNPTKPSNVDVDALKNVLTKLQRIQSDIQENAQTGPWSDIGGAQDIESALGGPQGGMQTQPGKVGTEVGKYYGFITTHITNSWTDVKSGVDTLVQLIQNTIDAHSSNDQGVAQGAQNVNTGASPDGKG